MSLNWEELIVQTDGLNKTPCDCCGTTTLEYLGDLYHGEDWVAFYWVRMTEGHPDSLPQFWLGMGNWSEGTDKTEKWIFGAEYSRQHQGFMLMDLARDSDLATYLDRDDIIGTDFAEEGFAMLDAIILKDDRLKELNA